MHKLKANSAWGGTATMRNCTFERFKGKTALDKYDTVFGLDEYQSDWVPPITLTDSTFIDISEDALAHFIDPNPAWAFIDDCGEFPCTGPLNSLHTFKNTKWLGVKPAQADADF